LDGEATVGRLTSALQASDAGVSVLHLACHALTQGRHDEETALLLYSAERGVQPWTAREISATAIPARLVVLSGCRTGGGSGRFDGAVGLARAFLLAGARQVVVSQWAVEDSATTEFMTEFHRQLHLPSEPSVALRETKQSLRRRGMSPEQTEAWEIWGVP